MRLSAQATLLYGAAAGMCAELATYPLEVIRRKMQLERILAARERLASSATMAASAGAQVSAAQASCMLSEQSRPPLQHLTHAQMPVLAALPGRFSLVCVCPGMCRSGPRAWESGCAARGE